MKQTKGTCPDCSKPVDRGDINGSPAEGILTCEVSCPCCSYVGQENYAFDLEEETLEFLGANLGDC